MDDARGARVSFAASFRLRGFTSQMGAVSCRGKMGEGTRRGARMEPHLGKRRHFWTASSHKTGPKWVCRGLVDVSTIFNRSTPCCSTLWARSGRRRCMQMHENCLLVHLDTI